MNIVDKKLINSKSGLKIVLSTDIESPFYKSEPRWIPDKEVIMGEGKRERKGNCREGDRLVYTLI